MNRLTAQTQMYIAIAVIVILVLVVTFLGILPLFQEASTLDDEIAARQQDLATAQALLARRQSAKAQSAENEVELMRLANQIPDSPQLPSVIIELQDVANLSGVELISITPSDLEVASDADGKPLEFSRVPVTVIVEGDWIQLIDYVGRISKLDRGIRVVNTSFAYIEKTDIEPAYVEGTVSLEVYVLGTASSEAPAASESSPATTTAP